jgi:GNAT superfamily N-acetyltransferase
LKDKMTNERLKVVCRPAREEDTQDVLELTRTIWEGDDYVPLVWRDWLADTQGRLAVAEYGGRVLGLGKLTRLATGQWWLEGLRTHPDFEGRGIAASLHDYLVNAWLQIGNGILRLATASFRTAVQHLSDRSGFTKVGEFSPFRATALEGDILDFRALEEKQVDSALEILQASPALALSNGLIDLGWEWCAPASELITESARQGEAFWWQGERGLVLTRLDQDDESGDYLLSLQTLACQFEDLAALLQACRGLAKRLDYVSVEWRSPLLPAALRALESAGFERGWDASVYVYAREHPKETKR